MSGEFSEKIQKQIDQGIEIIRKGGVVAFPTDTVYGLGAGAYIEKAIERIFQIKQRPLEMALPVLIGSVAQLHDVALDIPAYGWALIKEFFPGGLTLVIFRGRAVKDIITAGGDTVAVRMPDHPVPLALINGSGMPIVGTSANLSGQINPLNMKEVRAQIGDSVDLLIDADPAPRGVESTVVDVTGEFPVILRQGAISKADMERVVKFS
jgi:L-threonylcarbamoyladenylate synthase